MPSIARPPSTAVASTPGFARIKDGSYYEHEQGGFERGTYDTRGTFRVAKTAMELKMYHEKDGYREARQHIAGRIVALR